MPFTRKSGPNIGKIEKWSHRCYRTPPKDDDADPNDPALAHQSELRGLLEEHAVSQHRISLRSDGLESLTLWTSELLSDAVSTTAQSTADVSWDKEVAVELNSQQDGK